MAAELAVAVDALVRDADRRRPAPMRCRGARAGGRCRSCGCCRWSAATRGCRGPSTRARPGPGRRRLGLGRLGSGRGRPAGLCLRVHEPPEDEDGGAARSGRRWVGRGARLGLRRRGPARSRWSSGGPTPPPTAPTPVGAPGRPGPDDPGRPRAGRPARRGGPGAAWRWTTRLSPRCCRDRVEPLTDLGVTVLLPAWWTGRARVGLRAKATTPAIAGSHRGHRRRPWPRRAGGLPLGGGPG